MLDITTSISSIQQSQPTPAMSVNTNALSDLQSFQSDRATSVTTNPVSGLWSQTINSSHVSHHNLDGWLPIFHTNTSHPSHHNLGVLAFIQPIRATSVTMNSVFRCSDSLSQQNQFEPRQSLKSRCSGLSSSNQRNGHHNIGVLFFIFQTNQYEPRQSPQTRCSGHLSLKRNQFEPCQLPLHRHLAISPCK